MEKARIAAIVLEAKAATYVGNGTVSPSCRPASHDHSWESGPWRYLDSYFGDTDFSGQEVLWLENRPVWAMGYFGHVVRPDLIDASRAGAVIKAALSEMYMVHQRFLGGMSFRHPFGDYLDENTGDVGYFSGREEIRVRGVTAYELNYHGGLVTSQDRT